jgi:hypothetical protein
MFISESKDIAAPVSTVLSPNFGWIPDCRRGKGPLTSKILPVLQSHTTIFTPSLVCNPFIRIASLEFVMDIEKTSVSGAVSNVRG